jgi:hypothetical protein
MPYVSKSRYEKPTQLPVEKKYIRKEKEPDQDSIKSVDLDPGGQK